MTPAVSIVTEDSWICRRLSEHLLNLDGFQVSVQPGRIQGTPAVTYFLPYLFREMVAPVGKSVALFTHYIPGQHQRRYEALAHKVDLCLTLTEQHQKFLSGIVGSTRVARVHLPVQDQHVLRPLKVGWFHRSPPGYQERKRTDLLKAISQLPWIKLFKSDGKLSTADLHQRMHEVDCFLTTSSYESGPVSFLEGLSLGKPVVIPKGVGLADEFSDVPGVYRFVAGSAGDMIRQLELIYQPIKTRLLALEKNTVQFWRESHQSIFRNLLSGV